MSLAPAISGAADPIAEKIQCLHRLLDRELARLERRAAAQPDAILSLDIGRNARTLQLLVALEHKRPRPAAQSSPAASPAAIEAIPTPDAAPLASTASIAEAIAADADDAEDADDISSWPIPTIPASPVAAPLADDHNADWATEDDPAVARRFAAMLASASHAGLMGLLALPAFEFIHARLAPTTRHLAGRYLRLAAKAEYHLQGLYHCASPGELRALTMARFDALLAAELSHRVDRLRPNPRRGCLA